MLRRLKEDIIGTASDAVPMSPGRTSNVRMDQNGVPITPVKELGQEQLPTEPTDEMVAFFEKRTAEHKKRVAENIRKLLVVFYGLDRTVMMRKAAEHDNSKYGNVEREPYIWLTDWHKTNHKTKYPPGIKEKVDMAKRHHIVTNSHHVEFHNKPTDMTKEDVAEMVCDWAGMAQEKGTDLKKWANKFMEQSQFNEDQKKYIDKIVAVFDKPEVKNVR